MRNLIARLWPRNLSAERPFGATSYAAVRFTPPPRAYAVAPLARMVRPYVLHAERHREVKRIDRSRLGLGVLLDISRREVMAA